MDHFQRIRTTIAVRIESIYGKITINEYYERIPGLSISHIDEEILKIPAIDEAILIGFSVEYTIEGEKIHKIIGMIEEKNKINYDEAKRNGIEVIRKEKNVFKFANLKSNISKIKLSYSFYVPVIMGVKCLLPKQLFSHISPNVGTVKLSIWDPAFVSLKCNYDIEALHDVEKKTYEAIIRLDNPRESIELTLCRKELSNIVMVGYAAEHIALHLRFKPPQSPHPVPEPHPDPVPETIPQLPTVLFYLDCSGSMSSSNKLENAKSALRIFLTNLHPGTPFNVISFSSEAEKISPDMLIMSDKTRNLAFSHIKNFFADGSTNLWSGLKAEGHLKNVVCFIITDGMFDEREETIALCQELHKMHNWTFNGLGIGDDADKDCITKFSSTGGKISFIQDGELIEKSLCSLLREALPETVSSSGVIKNLQLWNGGTLVSDTTLPSYMPATDEIDVYALLPVTKEPLHIRLTATSPTVGAITTVYDVIEIPESLSNRRSPQLPYSRTMLHIATVIALANHSEFSGKFVEWSKLYGFEMGETNFFGQMSQSFDRVDARPSYQLMTIRDEIDRAERLQQDIQNCTLTLREQLCANVSIFRGLLSKIINKFSIAESFRDISCKLREIEQKEQQWTGSRSNSPTLVRRICEDLACEESNTLRIFSAILNRDISNLNWFFEYDDELSLLIKNIEILRPHYPAAFIGVKKKILNDCVTVLQAITSWVRSVREHGEELLRFQEQFVKKPEREFISPLATFRYRVRDDLEKLRNQTVANSSLLTRLNIFDILSSHLAELETVGRCISDIGHNLVIVQSDLAHQSHVLSDLHTQELILNDKILSQNADCSPIKSIPFCYHQRISSEEILLNKIIAQEESRRYEPCLSIDFQILLYHKMRFQEPYILSWNEWNGNDPIHLLINFYSDVGIFRPSLEELEQFFQSDTTISLSQDKESIIQKLSECHNDPLMISLLFVNFLVEVLPSERVKWQPIGHRCVTHIMRSMNDMDSFVHSLLLTRSWIRDWRIVHYEQHTQISSFDSELLRAYVKDDLANEILDTSTSTSGSSSSSLEKEYFFRLWKETHFQI